MAIEGFIIIWPVEKECYGAAIYRLLQHVFWYFLFQIMFVSWQLMALLLLRHSLTISSGEDDDDDGSNFFSVSGSF